ncbi:MAG: cell envelope integrity protein CreD [Pseudopedobacter saltans]|uniref:Cell envelope integrity protein CreD n=1 Tax=Pseudopedobacter saltans TaxID=151895 RepID=A0A2W5F558_9SPHI|nr:MAG: cell envelope integrity protein CreD [Pseudopedobacter saltans]
MENQITEPNATFTETPSFWQSYKFVFKGLFIGFLILLMLIPSFFVQNLVHERATRKDEVVAEVSKKWGNTQTIYGPLLVIPYMKTVPLADNKTKDIKDFIYYLPESLQVSGDAQAESRHRSIYDVTLYKTNIHINGKYSPNLLANSGVDSQKILWKEAYLQLGLSDIKGLEKQISVNWDNSLKGDFDVINYSSNINDVVADTDDASVANTTKSVSSRSGHSDLSFPIDFDPNKNHDFNIELYAKGSGGLYFTPTGSQTEVTLKSSWKSPSFDGNYLPSNSPDSVNVNGFAANWNIPKASRPYSQVNVGTMPNLDASVFGVQLLQPNDSYAKNERSAKYAILFVTLTFAVFFLMELLQKKSIHFLQYILVGFALILFYVLLLSISEYAGFNMAYFIAALSIILLISLYVGAILHSKKAGASFGFGLAALYGFIFFLIQKEDYTLLYGSIGLFIVLALIMYFTRKLNQEGNKQLALN